MMRQLAILVAAFLGGTAIAAALGAANLGTALGIGQLCFAAALVLLLLRAGRENQAGRGMQGDR
ncbi:MAG TPA: hypothetical protein VF729_02480 [Solirubrobacterales bacterium]